MVTSLNLMKSKGRMVSLASRYNANELVNATGLSVLNLKGNLKILLRYNR